MEVKNDNELIENQDLIDGFMGKSRSRMSPSHQWRSYHNDWNRLMPVVEKINNGFGTINIDSNSVFIHSENDLLNHIYNNQSDSGKIGAVYAAVVYFIKWYNSTPKEGKIGL